MARRYLAPALQLWHCRGAVVAVQVEDDALIRSADHLAQSPNCFRLRNGVGLAGASAAGVEHHQRFGCVGLLFLKIRQKTLLTPFRHRERTFPAFTSLESLFLVLIYVVSPDLEVFFSRLAPQQLLPGHRTSERFHSLLQQTL